MLAHRSDLWRREYDQSAGNGTYEMGGRVAGRYKAGKGQVQFDGALKDWNNGVARIENGTLIFEWKNSDGSMQYFAYSR